jgi:hypothetical protein
MIDGGDFGPTPSTRISTSEAVERPRTAPPYCLKLAFRSPQLVLGRAVVDDEITQMSLFNERKDVNAIRVPSGDHVGS